jgi:hypothetical protein
MLLLLALVVLAALGFTIAAFWWIYLRPGKLTVVAPATYATPKGAVLHLRFPFVFVNDGAVTNVVSDLRLKVAEGGIADRHEFHWTSIRSKVSPSMDDFVDSAAPFVVNGRDARRLVLDFGQVPPEWRPEPGGSYPVRLEASNGQGEWRSLLEFTWFAPERAELLESGVAHRNTRSGGPLV